MKYTVKNLPRKSIVATVVASALAFGATAAAQSSSFQKTDLIKLTKTQSGEVVKKTKQQQLQKVYPQYYIVQLEDEALATYQGDVRGFSATKPSLEGEKLNLQSREAQDYGSYLKARQQSVLTAMRNTMPDVQVQRQLSVVMNGFIVSHPTDKNLREKLAKIPGVKHVFEHKLYHAKMDASNDLINTPEVWANVGGRDTAGAGIKVAIIDGGIRSEHPMFAANGHTRPEGLPNDDYCAVVDPTFCNDKLVLARYYEPTFAVNAEEFPDSPLDFGGHGTHVAGTAVGNFVETNYSGVDVGFSGVAPGATLMVYKALFQTPAGTGSGSNVMLTAALEDAVKDGADVINNSWGGGAGGDPANSPYRTLFEAAEDAGVVVVTAAGNDGPGAQTVGCPGCVESGLTVASTQTGRTFGNVVDAAGIPGIEAFVGDGDFEISENITGPLMTAETIDAANGEACAPFPADSLAGHILFTVRGTCAFTDKANNAEDAGAIGMIMANNAEGVISMSMPGVTLPSVSILQADGDNIVANFEVGDEATIYATEQEFNEANVDVMSDFSSRGPNGDSSFLKPDIAAPGSDILSSYAPRGGEYNVISGTSMASPHVAGSAALLLQQRPDLEPLEVKSILMTSSVDGVLKEDAETPADAFDVGAGRLDVAAASDAMLSFDKVSLVSPACIGTCSFERTVTNLSGEEVTLTGSVEFDDTNLVGELSATEVTVAAGESATFELVVDSSFAAAGWKFGEVVWRDASGSQPDARMPVVVFASGSDDEQIASNTRVTGDPIVVGTPFAMRSVAGDNGGTSASTVTITIPEGIELDEDSLVVTEDFAVRESLDVSVDDGTIAWTGMIQDPAPVVSLEPAPAFPFAGFSLTDASLENSAGCDTGCDEQFLNFNLGATISYGGIDYSAVTVSANGMLTLGTQTLAGTWQPQDLPNETAPNNVLAPLWADLQIGAPQTGDLFFASVNDGTNDWVVFEWNSVQEFESASGDEFTFAIWLKVGTDEIYYNYIDMPATMPAASSVGFENSDGTIGVSNYFNGTGTAPATSDALQVVYTQEAASVAFEYDVLPNSVGLTKPIELEAEEGTEAIEIDLNDVATIGIRGLSEMTVSSDAGSSRSILPIDVATDGAVTLEITVQPENGTLTEVPVDDIGSLAQSFEYIYTPNDGFTGEDSFSYKLVDEGGNESAEATASVTIAAAPEPEPEPEPTPEPEPEPTPEPEEPVGETPDEAEPEDSDDKKWYEGSFNALIALLALPLVWLRRRRVTTKS